MSESTNEHGRGSALYGVIDHCRECEQEIFSSDLYLAATAWEYECATVRFHMACVYAVLGNRANELIEAELDQKLEGGK